MAGNTTRESIIEAANKLYLERGYDKVTVMDICAACKITKTTFYYHLKSKEDTILDFYTDVTHSITKQLSEILMADNHWEQLLLCFRILITETKKYGSEFMSQMMISNLKEDSHSFDMRDDLTNVAIAVIRKAQESGQIHNKADAEQLYTAAAYAFSGMELIWCIKSENFSWDKELMRTLECIFEVDDSVKTAV